MTLNEWKSTKQQASRFSFLTNDFSQANLKYKDAIRSIFVSTWFKKLPFLELSAKSPPWSVDYTKINITNLNRSINVFKDADLTKFNLLYDYTLKGLGPGEVLLYLIINDSFLGGGSSAATDLIVKNLNFEIKSGKREGSGFYHDFRFGGTINDQEIKNELLSLGQANNLISKNVTAGSSLAIPHALMKKIESLNKEEYLKIEKKYCNIVKNYFNQTSIVIFDRNSKEIKILKQGNTINEGDVGIYRIANGIIEPKVFP